MASTWVRVDIREYKTGNISVIETKRTPMIDTTPQPGVTTSITASIKEGTYSNLTVIRNGLTELLAVIDMWIAS